MVDDESQETLSMNSTHARFRIRNMLSANSLNVKPIFADGLPANYTACGSVDVTPQFFRMSTSFGSSGGTLITVEGTGFGKETTGLNLRHKASGEDLCMDPDTVPFDVPLGVVEYGKFNCMTKPFTTTELDDYELVIGDQTYGCYNSDSSDCHLKLNDNTSPLIKSAAFEGATKIIITGVGFESKQGWTP
jgi:hypothetical protein